MERYEPLPQSFDELIAHSDKPVLVDFWATWCAPCRMVAPIVRSIASRYKGRLLTVKVDIDRRPQIAGRYEITAVPTLLLFAGGTPVVRILGVRPLEEVARQIEPYLSAAAR